MAENIPQDELISELQRLCHDLNSVPTARDVEEHSEYALSTYQRRFGSWAAAKDAAELPENGAFQEPEPWQKETVLRELYVEENLSQAEIADRFGVSDSSISNWIRKHDIDTDPDYPWWDEYRLRELYWEQEMTLREIAEKWDTHVNTIYNAMKRIGIDRRRESHADFPWQDEETLRELYFEKGLSQQQIADRYNTSQPVISDWFLKFGIETPVWYEAGKQSRRVERAMCWTGKSGYEQAGARVGDDTKAVRIHRLVAIAEYGIGSVKDRVVHHANGIPWDNRPVNLEVMEDSAHKRLHRSTEYDPHDVESV